MADDLKPLSLEEPALSVDGFSTDFDENLKKETAAARAKPLSEFPGDKPVASSDEVVASGNVDDDALRAAVAETVTETPAAEPVAASNDVQKVAAATDKPADAAPVAAAEPAKPAVAADPAKPTYDPAEAFALADGVSLTREQIAQGLRERNAWGQAANTFAQVFRCTPEQAQQYWKPYVERLVAQPELGTWIDASIAMFDNPAKLAYIKRCNEFFDTENGGAAAAAARPAAAQPAQIPAEIRNELAEARNFRQRIEQQNAADRVTRERADLVKTAPALAIEENWKRLCAYTHGVMLQQEKAGVPVTYTLADGLRDMQRAASMFVPAPAQAAAPAAPPAKVPALNASSGASAAAARPAIDMKPKKFASPDDALADWDTNIAPALGYK